MYFTSEVSQHDSNNPNYAAMQTEQMRNMLTQVSRGLSTAMAMLAPQRRVDKQQRKALAFQKHLMLVQEEHKRILARKVYMYTRYTHIYIHRELLMVNRRECMLYRLGGECVRGGGGDDVCSIDGLSSH